MTDAEIKKALECCGAGVCKAECFGYFIAGTNDCTTQLAKYALDLINRQKAEIERLERDAFTYKIRWAKAEAYKECIEAVKNIICDNTYPDFDENGKAVCVWRAEAYREIDNILNRLEESYEPNPETIDRD